MAAAMRTKAIPGNRPRKDREQSGTGGGRKGGSGHESSWGPGDCAGSGGRPVPHARRAPVDDSVSDPAAEVVRTSAVRDHGRNHRRPRRHSPDKRGTRTL